MVLFAGYVSYGLFRIQILEHEVHAEAAAQVHYRKIAENPVRGSIVDRNGIELAVSSVTKTIGMTPSTVKGSRDGVAMTRRELAEGIAEALGLDPMETRWLFTDVKPAEGLVPEEQPVSEKPYVQIKKRIPIAESLRLEEFIKKGSIRGIVIDEEVKRYYPDGRLAPQVVGFASQDGHGLLGLESRFDAELAGSPGFTYVETDNFYGRAGLPFSVPTSLRAKDGLTLTTTLDARIQSIAAEELQRAISLYQVEDGGVAIVMDPYTGGVLAMVSYPDFDANDPTAIPDIALPAGWDPDAEPVENLSKYIWRNRAISDTYEPGSTFKSITSAIAFEEGLTTESEMFSDKPVLDYEEWPISCWKRPSDHGLERFEQAFWNSCNPIFVHLSQRIGIERYYRYVKAFGFHETTGIDLPGEGTGILHAQPRELDLWCLSFGEQSTVTPIALLNSYCAFANGGSLMRPRIVSTLSDASGHVVTEYLPETLRRVVSETTAARMRSMMEDAVLYGTGGSGRVEGYAVAGKTSTSTRKDGKHVLSFAAMAPAGQPRICVLVVLNGPASSKTTSAATADATARIVSRSLETMGVERVYTDRDVSVLSKTEKLPDFRGMTVMQARKAASVLGLYVEGHPDALSDGAIVESQFPPAGTSMHRGGGVVVSADAKVPEESAVMPDLTGKTASEAIQALYESGLNAVLAGDLDGLATSQAVAPGEKMPRWSAVTVVFVKDATEG